MATGQCRGGMAAEIGKIFTCYSAAQTDSLFLNRVPPRRRSRTARAPGRRCASFPAWPRRRPRPSGSRPRAARRCARWRNWSPATRPATAPAIADRERRVLRFEVSAETFAEFREALDRLERDAGERLTDDDALRQMARQILGGPTDDMCIEATPLAWLDPGPVRNQVMFKKGTWRVPGHSPTRARAAVRGGGAPR